LFKRQQLVAEADRRVMEYVCPEAQRLQLEAEDPLMSAAEFVERGKQLESWAEELSYPATPPPASFAGPLDSLRGAIRIIANSFTPAVERAAFVVRGCYREYAVDCDKLLYGRSILSRIDAAALRRGRDHYFRQRAALAELFAKADAPLTTLTTCREGV